MNVNGVGRSATDGGVPQLGQRGVGKEDFLRLLVTQLSNQNPLEPMDGTGFVTQLAQFSSLEQLAGVNERLEALSAAQIGLVSGQSIALVGRTVSFRGNQVALEEGGRATLAFDLGAPARVTVTVRDAAGQVVRTFERDGLTPGRNDLVWDGHGDDGSPLPAGTYTFDVKATDDAGATVTADTYGRGRVEGVSYQGGVPRLRIGTAFIEPSEVLEVAG
jgi:flagellar basal-body rod modification protein FlgD